MGSSRHRIRIPVWLAESMGGYGPRITVQDFKSIVMTAKPVEHFGNVSGGPKLFAILAGEGMSVLR